MAFFSWSGNTRLIAAEIASQTGADLVELECASPYSGDCNTCLEEAQRDQNMQARPELATHIDDMDRYGTIYLGYPNWWASTPMPIATFLESCEFSGKAIRPFCSNGGGLGQCVAAVSKLVPDTDVGQGLSVYYSGTGNTRRIAEAIADRLGAKHLKARAITSKKTKWKKGKSFYGVPSQKAVSKWVAKL